MVKNVTVALYARVSTNEQAENGHSLEAQCDILKKYANQVGYKYHRIYRDGGYSGKDLNRPALQQLLWGAYYHKFDELFVWRIDRLTRDTHDLLEIIEYLKACDVLVKSATEPFFDTTTPTGECMLTVMGSFSQMERKILVERIRMGLQKRREEGKWSGTPPYGYDYDKTKETLVINAEEAKIVKLIFDNYLERKSMPAVRDYLNAQGIRPRISEKWQVTSIAAILSKKIYTGIVKTGDEEKEIASLRIIVDKLFQVCQTLRNERRNQSPKLKEMPKTYEEGCFCHSCGRHCQGDMKFCPGCGAMVHEYESARA
jgi:site-specific DNA recombinase